ncbi:MAG: hypothetical protein ABEH43_11550 [Flavobacteriales bacterium]
MLNFFKIYREYEPALIKDYMNSYRKYIHEIDFNIEKMAKNLEDDLAKTSRDELEDERYQDWLEEEVQNYNSFFPYTFRNSVLITSFSFFDKKLKEMCVYMQDMGKKKIKLDEIKGKNSLDRYRKYLIKVCDVRVDKIDDNWSRIINYWNMRNIIIHNNGIVDKKNDKKVRTFVNSEKELEINKDGYLFIKSSAFLNKVIGDLEDYLVFVAKRIKD